MEDLQLGRYEIQESIGKGAFSHIHRAFDKHSSRAVAIKYITKQPSKIRPSYSEGEILKILHGHGSPYKDYVIQLCDSFSMEKISVYVFELLYCDLFTAMAVKYYKGCGLDAIANIGLQLCEALCHLQDVELEGIGKTSLIHNDLKLDNIMFTDDSFTNVKIIDFGKSVFQCEKLRRAGQILNFRAPEVFFLADYEITPAVDMWSVGVVLFTLFNNNIMFRSVTKSEQMANLVCVFGEPSLEMMKDNSKLGRLFDRHGDKLLLKQKYSKDKTQKYNFIEMFGKAAKASIHSDTLTASWVDQLYDFLLKIFDFNPKFRLKPNEAAHHPFFKLAKLRKHISSSPEKYEK